jgi:hypothetical protein
VPPVLPTQYVETLSEALAVLAAMITPALLITASGTFILSTSQRLGRVIDRVRNIGDRMDALLHDTTGIEMIEERKTMLMEQMRHQSYRATLLQRTLSVFYIAACLFVLTSIAIGVDALLDKGHLHWLPVALGIGGASCLLYGSAMLIIEARLAVSSLREEMAFLNKLVTPDPHNIHGSVPR